MAVDGAKNVGASAAAIGAKAADGAKSVGASAVVSCSRGCQSPPPNPFKKAIRILPFFSSSVQAIGSKGIATAGSKLKASAPRELLSSPHLYVAYPFLTFLI